MREYAFKVQSKIQILKQLPFSDIGIIGNI